MQGVIFSTHLMKGESRTRRANLIGTNFYRSDLRRTRFNLTNIQGAYFWRANLCEASLKSVNATNVRFGYTNLSRVNFYGADLNGADLLYADLTGAQLKLARLSNAVLIEIQLGEGIIQESEEAYHDYFVRWYTNDLPEEARLSDLALRYRDASEIYMNLKNGFLSSGRYREASWAYIKERQMRRATFLPRQAKSYYGQTTATNPGFLKWRWGWFYLKYSLLWLADWLTDLTSGYGERPLRTLWVALAFIFVFPLFYWLSGQVRLQTGDTLSGLDYLIYSLGAFSTMDFSRFETTGVIAETLASIEALLGISILALLMFALGNRISRS